MTLPPFLKPGDKVALCATARWIDAEALQAAVKLIESWGYLVHVSAQVEQRNFQLAGNAHARTGAMQVLLDDPEISALVVVRGGYGTVHLLDLLDFTAFSKAPKWVCGYSDITALHAHINHNLGVASIHSTMPVSFPHATEEALKTLRDALSGRLNTFRFPTSAAPAQVQGTIMGGNMSVLYSLLGSQQQLAPEGILFLEDVDEMYYHIDRMMFALKRAGVLSKVKAILLGGFTQMKDNTPEFGFSVNNPWGIEPLNTLRNIATELGIPVIDGFPAGHQNDNRAFFLNAPADLNVDDNGIAELTFRTLHAE